MISQVILRIEMIERSFIFSPKDLTQNLNLHMVAINQNLFKGWYI
jgi:hypothetical protein